MIRRLVSLVLLAWALGFAWFVVALPRPADDAPTDAIVVLSGAKGRIERGLDLLARKRARALFFSGVERTVRSTELAERTGRPAALFACCVTLGQEAVDTRSNAEESAAWLKARRYRSVRLVTTDWHMPRARFELERLAGGAFTIMPDAVKSEPNFAALFTEYNKYILRRLAVLIGV